MQIVHPSTILISGPTGSGKTNFVSNLLKFKLIDPFPEKITWIYGEWQATYETLLQLYPFIQFLQGFPPNFYDSLSANFRNLLIIDDQMTEIGDSKELSKLFTKGSHHRNLSIVYIVQNLFDKGRSMRTVSINSQYIILFKNSRDKSQIAHLPRQMYPGNSNFLVSSFQDATDRPFGYLVLDLRPETKE